MGPGQGYCWLVCGATEVKLSRRAATAVLAAVVLVVALGPGLAGAAEISVSRAGLLHHAPTYEYDIDANRAIARRGALFRQEEPRASGIKPTISPSGHLSDSVRSIVAPSGAADDVVGAVGPNRIVGPGDVELPGVPSGVQGVPTTSGHGLAYDLPAGTSGIDPSVTQIRAMDPLTTGAHEYPNGYVAYMNQTRQTVNPLTGQTSANSDPFVHIPLPG